MNPLICDNLSVREGRLFFAGRDLSELASRYGTPLYLMDEDRIRANCRLYAKAMAAAFGDKGAVFYASKAASFKQMYRIIGEEGLSADAVSVGEIATALAAGFPAGKLLFHSNNKTDNDIAYALDNGVGLLCVDSFDELEAIEEAAAARGKTQKVLLRLTPGIDPHTYEAVATGKIDSKFGFGIPTGEALKAVKKALSLPHLSLTGYHCHLGSQLFDESVYIAAAEVMLGFTAEAFAATGYAPELLDLGGGFGVRYTEEQPTVDIAACIQRIGRYIDEKVKELGLLMPKIALEPGRSLVADAGLTLYTVGSVKEIPGYKTYVSVDGGMTDNPRYALYKAPYTIAAAEQPCAAETRLCTVAGRCCESGDILQENVPLPKTLKRGDLLACFTTGAYHYSMASNYNRLGRPALAMLADGRDYLAVKRETADDLMRLDL